MEGSGKALGERAYKGGLARRGWERHSKGSNSTAKTGKRGLVPSKSSKQLGLVAAELEGGAVRLAEEGSLALTLNAKWTRVAAVAP